MFLIIWKKWYHMYGIHCFMQNEKTQISVITQSHFKHRILHQRHAIKYCYFYSSLSIHKLLINIKDLIDTVFATQIIVHSKINIALRYFIDCYKICTQEISKDQLFWKYT